MLATWASKLPYITVTEEFMARYDRATDYTKRGLARESHEEMLALSTAYSEDELENISPHTLNIIRLIVVYNFLEGRGCEADVERAYNDCNALMSKVCRQGSLNENRLFLGWLFYLMGITSMKVGKEGMLYLKTAADVYTFNGAQYSLGVFLYNGDDLAGNLCNRNVRDAKRYLRAASAENDLAKDALASIAQKPKRLRIMSDS
jgi:hypothetical protein